MDQRIVQFIAALRASGVRISLAESADAFLAVENMGIQDRNTFRITLRTTLIKDKNDSAQFEKLFPLFFQSDDPPRMMDATQEMTPEEAKMLAQALKQFSDQLREMLEKLLEGRPLTRDEMDQLDQMINMEEVNDLRYQNWLARQMEQALKFNEVREALEELMSMLRKWAWIKNVPSRSKK